MKRFGVFLVFAAMTFIPGGCGVHVGNGYRSPHGFSVRYSDQLTFNEGYGGRSVTIDNRSLARNVRSTVSIDVNEPTRVRVTNVEQLLGYARARARGDFNIRSVPGAIAVAANVLVRGVSYRGDYFFLLSSGKIVHGRVDAVAEGEGLNLVGPILDTFRGDGAL